MRISDWCSDVCSSDLIALRGGMDAVGRGARLHRAFGGRQGGGVIDESRAGAPRIIGDPRVERADLVGDRNPRPPRETVRRRDRGKRSEEHTSELQSLMRISYAVFCLKKKKTQLINTNNTHTNTKY